MYMCTSIHIYLYFYIYIFFSFLIYLNIIEVCSKQPVCAPSVVKKLNLYFVPQDAHNSILNFDKDAHLFAVYDGHGGHEVSAYTALKLPDFIKETEAYKKGNFSQALTDAFLGFDATLTKAEVVNILKQIAGTKDEEEGRQLCYSS